MLTGSVAVAALGSSFAFITKTLSELDWHRVLAAGAIGLAAVLVPALMIAWFRLRRRNLSALLEASGWAVNAPMYLTLTLGRVLSVQPERPSHFGRELKDRLWGLSRDLTHLAIAPLSDDSDAEDAEEREDRFDPN